MGDQLTPRRLRGVLALVLLFSLTSCRSEPDLKPFTSDGCSLFPDRSIISAEDWCSCCFEHDIAYWRGGTKAEREAADAALRDCVTAKTGDRAFGRLMYDGVRVGGSPYFLTWYRWGYGWPFARKYQALTDAETAQSERLLADYRASNPEPVCPANVKTSGIELN
ncbi:MAG: hypothetical protein AAFY69_10655 [Pseudomonadota bacterium]